MRKSHRTLTEERIGSVVEPSTGSQRVGMLVLASMLMESLCCVLQHDNLTAA